MVMVSKATKSSKKTIKRPKAKDRKNLPSRPTMTADIKDILKKLEMAKKEVNPYSYALFDQVKKTSRDHVEFQKSMGIDTGGLKYSPKAYYIIGFFILCEADKRWMDDPEVYRLNQIIEAKKAEYGWEGMDTGYSEDGQLVIFDEPEDHIAPPDLVKLFEPFDRRIEEDIPYEVFMEYGEPEMAEHYRRDPKGFWKAVEKMVREDVGDEHFEEVMKKIIAERQAANEDKKG